MRLNIGCGKQHLEGYVNIDISGYCKPDRELDIRGGLPFVQDSIEEIIANGVLEMILPNEEFRFVLNELWRVLKSTGILKGQVPGFQPEKNNFKNIFYDPFDHRFFQKDTFSYWTHDAHAYREFGTNYGFQPWDVRQLYFNENEILCFEMTPHK